MTSGLILFALLMILLIGVLPVWPYARHWSYRPFGAVSLLLVLVIVLMLVERI